MTAPQGQMDATTSGPWAVDYRSVHDVRVCSSEGPRETICTLGNWLPEHHAERDANAALIAQAPTLLAERDRLKAVNVELVKALEAAQEEFRLIRMKDHGTVYNPALGVQIAVALTRAKAQETGV